MDINSLSRFIQEAKEKIIFLGIFPLISYFENGKFAKLFADKLRENPSFKIDILYESGTEVFNQSLFINSGNNEDLYSFNVLKFHKNYFVGGEYGKTKSSFLGDILRNIDDDNINWINKIEKNIRLFQFNLRQSINIIKIDSKIWYAPIVMGTSKITSYISVDSKEPLYNELVDYLIFVMDKEKGGKFLSRHDEEMIEIYDLDDYPRGIYPRDAFLSTDYQRYSIWGLVFNRNGELLLHQRSKNTKDNRLLWDKSTGGHVDLREISTSLTAKRELIEELLLPEAEYTNYVRPDLGDIIDFGDWSIEKRIERNFRLSTDSLSDTDWIMFRPTEKNGFLPVRVKRVSQRQLYNKDSVMSVHETRFISDIYLYIAPEGFMDTYEQMKDKVKAAEKTGAAEDHKLLSIRDLCNWINHEKREGRAKTLFTDDLIYICNEYHWLLEEFAEFVKLAFKNEK